MPAHNGAESDFVLKNRTPIPITPPRLSLAVLRFVAPMPTGKPRPAFYVVMVCVILGLIAFGARRFGGWASRGSSRSGTSAVLSTALQDSARALEERQVAEIRRWYAVIEQEVPTYRQVRRDLSGFSVEGGKLDAYFDNASLRKLVAIDSAESGRRMRRFYYRADSLVFVHELTEPYVHPPDSATVRRKEDRYYFAGGRLIRWIDDRGREIVPTSTEARKEEAELFRLSAAIQKLLG